MRPRHMVATTAGICVLLLVGVLDASAFDPKRFPGKGSRVDWEKECEYCDRGVDLAHQGKHAEAQELYKKAIAIYPNDAAAYFCYANDLKRTKQIPEAIEKYKKALSLAPDYHEAYAQMADAFLIQKNYFAAEDACRKALQINPKSAGAMINLSESYMGTKRLAEARKWLDAASKCPDASEPLCRAALAADYEKLEALSKSRLQAGD